MSKQVIQVLTEKRAIVWREIQKYLKQAVGESTIKENYSKANQWQVFHQDLICDYPKRLGKYLRPTLLLLTAQAMGFPLQKAIKTAAVMQTSEDWILIHDDVEDESEQRRGKLALHKIYGKELAINAGDGLHILMWQMLWDNIDIVGQAKAAEITTEFIRILKRTVFGQTIEIKWTQENKIDLTDEDVFFIIDGKTVYYSIAGPMRLGAILAGADQKQLKLLYEFGLLLGRSFQIVDDLLDLTSDFSGQKRQQGNDIYEGKRTIMLGHLLRTLSGKDKGKLINILAKKRDKKTVEEVSWVINKMKKSGSLDYGRQMAQDLAGQAKNFFEQELKFLKKEPARSQLRMLIDFVVERKY